jgi:hypothetical protein
MTNISSCSFKYLSAAVVVSTLYGAGNIAKAQATDASNKFSAANTIANAKDGKMQKMEIKEQMAARAAAGEVRDWNAIDVNKDNSISPEEMETYLKKVWAAKKK